MKDKFMPIKPIRPKKPIEPSKYLSSKIIKNFNDAMMISEILATVPNGVSPSEICIYSAVDSYDYDCSDPCSYIVIEYDNPIPIDNPHYDKEMQIYNNALKYYKERYIKYKEKMNKYKEDLNEYNNEEKKYNIMNLKTQIEFYQNALKKIELQDK